MRQLSVILMTLLLFTACSKRSSNPEPIYSVSFEPHNLTLDAGQTGTISLNMEITEESIFGVTLQMSYDSSFVSFSTANGVAAGDFFGDDIISLVEVEENVIHLAFSLTQGQAEASGSGVLATLQFSATAPGISPLVISPAELHFYDSAGTELIFPDLEIGFGSISVQ